MLRVRGRVLPVVVVGLVLAGCSGGDSEEDPTQSAGPSPSGSSSAGPDAPSGDEDSSSGLGPSAAPGELPEIDDQVAKQDAADARRKPVASGAVTVKSGKKLEVDVLAVEREAGTLHLTAVLHGNSDVSNFDMYALGGGSATMAMDSVRLVHGQDYVEPMRAVAPREKDDKGYVPTACLCSTLPLKLEDGQGYRVEATFADFEGDLPKTVDVAFVDSEPIKDVEVTKG